MSVVTISPLEVLGALSAKLTHDLNNQMTIITGSAQFAQIVMDDRERVEGAVKSIVIATEKMSRLVGVVADYRRDEGLSLGSASIDEISSELQERLVQRSGWTLDSAAPASGRVPLSPHWVALGVDYLIDAWQSSAGPFRVSIRQATEISQRIRTAGNSAYLEIRLVAENSDPLDIDGLRAEFRPLEFIAVLEVFKAAGGCVWSERLEGGSSVTILLPMTAGETTDEVETKIQAE